MTQAVTFTSKHLPGWDHEKIERADISSKLTEETKKLFEALLAARKQRPDTLKESRHCESFIEMTNVKIDKQKSRLELDRAKKLVEEKKHDLGVYSSISKHYNKLSHVLALKYSLARTRLTKVTKEKNKQLQAELETNDVMSM